MLDTKICEQCGKEYTRTRHETPVRWAQRKYCSKVCAGTAKREAPRPMAAREKTCLHCGATFSRRLGEQACNYNKRAYCSKSCARSKPHSGDGFVHRFIERNCECGERATGLVWIIQLTANMLPIIQCIEVCADCRDMWLDDGATLDKPEIVKQHKLRYEEPEYHLQAHFHSWNHRKGARP